MPTEEDLEVFQRNTLPIDVFDPPGSDLGLIKCLLCCSGGGSQLEAIPFILELQPGLWRIGYLPGGAGLWATGQDQDHRHSGQDHDPPYAGTNELQYQSHDFTRSVIFIGILA